MKANCRSSAFKRVVSSFVWSILLLTLPHISAEMLPGITSIVDARLQPLPAKTRGVLCSKASAAFSIQGKVVPDTAIGFASGNFGYHEVYIQNATDGDNLTLKVGDGTRSQEFPRLRLAQEQDIFGLGITQLPCLVEVEVNAGLGGPAEGAFFASKIRQIDGTPACPVKVADMLRTVETRFATWADPQRVLLKRSIQNENHDQAWEEQTLRFMTWLENTQCVHFQFVYYSTRLPNKKALGITSSISPSDQRSGTSYGLQKTVLSGIRYEVDVKGNIKRRVQSEPRTVTQDLPPPQ